MAAITGMVATSVSVCEENHLACENNCSFIKTDRGGARCTLFGRLRSIDGIVARAERCVSSLGVRLDE
jgi:hypothetical protein